MTNFAKLIVPLVPVVALTAWARDAAAHCEGGEYTVMASEPVQVGVVNGRPTDTRANVWLIDVAGQMGGACGTRARSTAPGIYLPSGGDPFASEDYIASVGPAPGNVYGDAVVVRVDAATPPGDYVVEVETNRKSDDVQPDNWVSIGQILVHVGPAQVVAHGSTRSDSGTAVVYDSSSQLYSAGVNYGAAAVQGVALSFEGGSDAWIAKQTAAGASVWVNKLGGTGTVTGVSIVVDSGGSVYASGGFTGALIARGTTATTATLTSTGSNDAFLAKWSSTGGLLWARRFGSTGEDRAYGVTVDTSGRPVITGLFTGTVTFVSGAPVTAQGSNDCFLTWHSAATGTATQQAIITGTGTCTARDIARTSDGGVVAVGGFTGLARFNNTSIGQSSSLGGSDAFVAKYTPTAFHSWRRHYGGAGDTIFYGAAADLSGRIRWAGTTTGVFGHQPLMSPYVPLFTSYGSFDAVVGAVANDGTPGFHRQAGGVGMDLAVDVALDGQGKTWVTGALGGPVVAGTYHQFTDAGILALGGAYSDAFVAAFSLDGQSVWGDTFGGASDPTGSPQEYGAAIAISRAFDVAVTGNFYGTARIGAVQATAAGGGDAFLLEISP